MLSRNSEGSGPPARRPRGAARVARVARALGILLAMLLLVTAMGAVWVRSRLTASLPNLDGEVVVGGLSESVRIERDALGIPSIHASNRLDLARATGFLHAQDRYFQMDLMRRRAAGELAELVGAAVISADRRTRRHRFREEAVRVVYRASAREKALMVSYAAGVNAGLAALGARPPEYLLLRSEPAPWTPEDTVLVIFAMFLDLNDPEGGYESMLGIMRDLLPGQMFDFLAPRGTEWDAPVIGDPFAAPPIPGPEVFDARLETTAARIDCERERRFREPRPPEQEGSNNWAVAGALTSGGGALLANDMHLRLSVPNTWYRASFSWADEDGRTARHVIGVTLPGAPAMVAGSNTHVAWSFTNSYGDWSDLVIVEPDPGDSDRYLTPEGPRRFERSVEKIRVKGGADETLEVVSTIWGPIIGQDHRGRPRACRWVAHDERAVNLGLLGWETAGTVQEALQVASVSGAPPQNFVVADSTGQIGWTIFGAIPRRVGFDGRVPESWADGTRRWDGWLTPEEYPRIVNPPGGRIWTANARVVDGEMLAKVGDGGYELGGRARQIRDDLLALDKARPADMLAIQLDDRALFLQRWRDLLLETLAPAALVADPRRGEVRKYVEDWGGRAGVESVGYRLVRGYRVFAAQRVFEVLTARCRKADARFDYLDLAQFEGPLWRLVTERPPHMLDPKYRSWDELLLAAVDATVEYLRRDGIPLANQTWGRRNTASIQHPLSLAVPLLGRWLDMPPRELPGDMNMPRVQGASFGASERMVVSPGREQEGILHMPCGQSGHPLSPHYGDGHEAWAAGEATPFLPGAAVHTLALVPAR